MAEYVTKWMEIWNGALGRGRDEAKNSEEKRLFSGKKKAHKHKRFGPVALGTAPGLSLGQTQLVPGTNPGLLLILHAGSQSTGKAIQ